MSLFLKFKSLCAALALLAAASGGAQTTETSNLVVGFPAGGTADALARALAEGLRTTAMKNVIVVNMPGAGGNIATSYVARAKGDGRTILMGGNWTHAFNPFLYARPGYDPIKDFVPLTRFTDEPLLVVVPGNSPFNSLRDYLEAARKRPGELTYATAGNGTAHHLAMSTIAARAKVELTHVPYRGGAPATLAALSGEVSAAVSAYQTVRSHVDAGKLKILGVTSAEEWHMLPTVGGLRKNGVADVDFRNWSGLWLPANTPPGVVQETFQAVTKALTGETLAQKMSPELRGTVRLSRSPEEFDAFVRKEYLIGRELVKQSGARID